MRSARLDHNPERRRFTRAKMTGDPVTLDLAMRRVVAAAVEEVCTHRRWSLLALNVRTTHVHVVLSCAGPPERPLAPFKAWSTRRWREAGLVAADRKLWAHHGSTRNLWKPEGLEGAIVSVRDPQ